jgi:hypothetical protein
MFGSLLLFSFDDFETFGTGVVRKADKKKMDEHMRRFGSCEIFIQIVNTDLSLLQAFNHYKGKTLVLLESRSYFEAFSHTLQTLKEMQSLPFESIIRGMPDFTLNQPDFFFENKKVIVEQNIYHHQINRNRDYYQYKTIRQKKQIQNNDIDELIST